MMRSWTRLLATASLLAFAPLPALGSEPLLSQGVGSSSCAKLADDIKPSEGLNDPVNLMLYAWVQGYISAANVALLEYDGRYVNMADLTVAGVLQMVHDYCKANPDRKPASALDTYVKTTTKMKTEWRTGTVQWDE